MDHSLRSISYIADIGDLLVIMARRRIMPQDGEELQVIGSTPKMICHVFESEEVFRPFIPNKIRRPCRVHSFGMSCTRRVAPTRLDAHVDVHEEAKINRPSIRSLEW